MYSYENIQIFVTLQESVIFFILDRDFQIECFLILAILAVDNIIRVHRKHKLTN